MFLQGSMFPLVLLFIGGAHTLERVPSDNLPAQGVDTFPTDTKHLPRLTGLNWRKAWEE